MTNTTLARGDIATGLIKAFGVIPAVNAEQALLFSLSCIMDYGTEMIVRGMKTKELINHKIVIFEPDQHFYFLAGRNDNVPAKCAEFLWMLAGRNDIEWLSYFLPRAPEFSDDGIVWRGAYGPRLRKCGELLWDNAADQLQYVVELLRRDPYSRQAVISLWDAVIDNNPGKDIPCNIAMQFLYRNGALHLHIFQRSSDAMWGMSGIDVFTWTTLLRMVATWVGVPVGEFHHTIGSLHIYERHWKRAYSIMADAGLRTLYEMLADECKDCHPVDNHSKPPQVTCDIKGLDGILAEAFRIINEAKAGYSVLAWLDMLGDDLIKAYTQAAVAYVWLQTRDEHGTPVQIDNLARMVNAMDYTDLRLALIEYISRQYHPFLDMVVLPETAYILFNTIIGD